MFNSNERHQSSQKAYNLNYSPNPSSLNEENEQLIRQISSVSTELEHFQSLLNDKIILDLWNNFRECENKIDGRILKKEFKKATDFVLSSITKIGWSPDTKRTILTLLFERFNYQENRIDIYDFLISLSILSRMRNDQKLILILQLVDVDEDQCLSLGELFKMILAIEKNFVNELNYLNFQSGILYNETAFKNALRKFRLILMGLGKPIEEMSQKYITQTLVTYPEFMNVVTNNDEIYRSFLPYNLSIVEFLKTRFTEFKIECLSENMKDLKTFMKDLHEDLRPTPEFALYVSKEPGIIELTHSHQYRAEDDQQSATLNSISHTGLGKGRLSKPKQRSKKSMQQQTVSNKDEDLLLDSLSKIKRFRANLDNEDFIEKYMNEKKPKREKNDDEEGEDEGPPDPEEFVMMLSNKRQEQVDRLDEMRAMIVTHQLPNSMPNTKMLNNALISLEKKQKAPRKFK